MKRSLFITAVLAMLASVTGCGRKEAQYYRVEDGKIMLGNVPQYFIGTNMWYAVKLGGGDETQKARLRNELDSLCGHAMWQEEIWSRKRMEWFDSLSAASGR